MHGAIKLIAYVCVCVCVCMRVRACVHTHACLLACTCDNSILVYANMFLPENTGINNCQRHELVIFSKDVSFSTVTNYLLDGWYSSFRSSKIFVFTAIFIYLLIQTQLLFNMGLKWPGHEAKYLPPVSF
jgi:hypothetical protein